MQGKVPAFQGMDVCVCAGSGLLRTVKESLKWFPRDNSKKELTCASYFLVQTAFFQESYEVAISILILLMRKNIERS